MISGAFLFANCSQDSSTSLAWNSVIGGPPGWAAWDSIPVTAHRGYACCFPENTLEAIEGAIQSGARSVEVDVRLTADRVPVLLHDPWLDRTTNAVGRLQHYTARQLEDVDACPDRPERCRLPTLREALELSHGQVRVVLDVKGRLTRQTIRPFVDQIRATHTTDEVAIISGDPRTLEWFRTLLGQVPVGMYSQISDDSRGKARYRAATLLVDRLLELGSAEIFLSTQEVYQRGDLYTAALERGLPVAAWTVYNRDEIRALLATPGVHRVLSDTPP